MSTATNCGYTCATVGFFYAPQYGELLKEYGLQWANRSIQTICTKSSM